MDEAATGREALLGRDAGLMIAGLRCTRDTHESTRYVCIKREDSKLDAKSTANTRYICVRKKDSKLDERSITRLICTLQVAVAIAICERTRYTQRACDAHAREHELTRFFCIEEKDLMLDVKSITRLICVLQVAVARHDGRDLSGDTGGWRLAHRDGEACLRW